MTIHTKGPKKPRKVQIDLKGPDGNAYVLLGMATKFAKQLGLDGDLICAEMKKGDYDNLVRVFDKHFGDYVDIYK